MSIEKVRPILPVPRQGIHKIVVIALTGNDARWRTPFSIDINALTGNILCSYCHFCSFVVFFNHKGHEGTQRPDGGKTVHKKFNSFSN
jgi:hypothetical protein